jgi:hypothetical protein
MNAKRKSTCEGHRSKRAMLPPLLALFAFLRGEVEAERGNDGHGDAEHDQREVLLHGRSLSQITIRPMTPSGQPALRRCSIMMPTARRHRLVPAAATTQPEDISCPCTSLSRMENTPTKTAASRRYSPIISAMLFRSPGGLGVRGKGMDGPCRTISGCTQP